MDFGTPPPMWQEPPVFCLPGVPSPQTSWSLKAHAVLIHGIDGTTYPDLGHSVLLPAFVGESETLRFSYSPSEVAGASATEETISLVATNLLELLRTRVAPATTLAGKDVDDSSLSIMFFAYDLGGTIVKEALTRASLDEQYRPVLEASSLVVCLLRNAPLILGWQHPSHPPLLFQRTASGVGS
ncbi:hypothetical protein BGZ61DRAFT_50972 [Ilyonectria robusta]|uniref:uncharacterized protein n=1 Tax=Ilyonectria robusta TaxID=1079257 RepID=UPI001E8ED507|nr:uncharacterized protein BGZ61DRAFT_50972 [Ilyonectria robusta]KAH8648711.1 hypothetical protein BGZ61DRAFT_50972 [Ilyonectria robusta]